MSSGNREVLVVDDDPWIRAVVVNSLRLEGYAVREAADGRQALEKIDEHEPCLILLDMQMPELDGWGLVRELKRRGLNLSIVVMTAGTDAAQAAQDVEAMGFVGKPFALRDLLAKVEAICPD
jgi:DNA-binding response OmpR family regulator